MQLNERNVISGFSILWWTERSWIAFSTYAQIMTITWIVRTEFLLVSIVISDSVPCPRMLWIPIPWLSHI